MKNSFLWFATPVLVLLVVLFIANYCHVPWVSPKVLYLSASLVVGCIAGYFHLVSKFSTGLGISPALLTAKWTWAFVALNGVASFSSAYIMLPSDLSLSFITIAKGAAWGCVGLLGLRAGLHLEDRKPFGPVAVLDTIYEHISLRVDTATAEDVWGKMQVLMRDIDFYKAKNTLAIATLLFREQYKENDRERLGKDIDQLEKENIDPQVRSVLLGIFLYRVIGIGPLEKIVNENRRALSWQIGSELDKLRDLIEDGPLQGEGVVRE